MKKIYITILCVLISNLVFSQTDFREGYVVQSGDTLKGLVDYRGSQRNATVVTYRASATGNAKIYNPSEIEGFGFIKENKIYESRLVPGTDSLNTTQKLFLETLVKGEANLFFYRDKTQKDRFYISKNDDVLEELKLVVRQHTDLTTGKKYIIKDEIYKETLMRAFSNCPSITKRQVDQVQLAHNPLSKITQQYNMCMGKEFFSKAPDKLTLSFGPTLGISSSTLKFTGQHDFSKSAFEESAPSLSTGLSLNISSPSLSEKLSIQLELLYTSNKFTSTYTENGIGSSSYKYDTYFDLHYLKLPTQIRYTYPRGKVKPFANAGSMLGYAISHEGETTRTTSLGGTSQSSTSPALGENGIRAFTTGLTAGVGALYYIKSKPVSIEARYERNAGMSGLLYVSSTVEVVYFMLSYHL